MTLFTGSSRVAEKLAGDLKGRIKLEDAGFDWKILGPDVQQVGHFITLALSYVILCLIWLTRYPPKLSSDFCQVAS